MPRLSLEQMQVKQLILAKLIQDLQADYIRLNGMIEKASKKGKAKKNGRIAKKRG